MLNKITLIIPPAPFLGDQKRNPPLGILYVASYLFFKGISVNVVDLRDVPEDQWLTHIPRERIYGITATSAEYSTAIKIAKKIKNKFRPQHIILGGFHASTAPTGTIDSIFDKIVVGEGERSALAIMNETDVYRRIYTDALIENLDDIPLPARFLLDESSFISDKLNKVGYRATTISVSRGCSYNCAFCASKAIWGRRVRFRSPDNVIAELNYLQRNYDVHSYRFHDDTMTINKKWLHEFCTKVENLKINWRTHTRVDRAAEPELAALLKAGCYEVGFGVEDPRDTVLKVNNKGIKSQQIYDAIATAKNVGLKTRVYLMIGIPGQDEDTSATMINFIEETKPDIVDLSTFVPLPGCDIYNNPDRYGMRIKDFKWDDLIFTVGLFGDEIDKDFLYEHDKLSEESLKRQRKEVLEYIKNRKITLNI